jgi:CRP-like cAMP-binding protein
MKTATQSAARSCPQPARPLSFRAQRPAAAGAGELEPSGRQLGFAARTHLFREGDPAVSVYEVIDGTIMLYKLMPDGRRQIVEVLGAGDVFGFSATAVHDCSAESLVAGHCIAFKRADLERLPALLQRLSGRIQAQFCALHAHAILLGRKSAMERVASFLLRCVPGRGGYACLGPWSADDGAKVRIGMTRQEIADFLGLTIETVSRSLSRLKRSGAISIDRLDEIVIHDICRMCRMTGTEATCERVP